MGTIDREYLLETIDRLSAYEDTVSVDALKKAVKDMPEVVGIKWKLLGGEEEPPENVALLVSFANAPLPVTGINHNGVFYPYGYDTEAKPFKSYGFIPNAWAIAPKGYEQ